MASLSLTILIVVVVCAWSFGSHKIEPWFKSKGIKGFWAVLFAMVFGIIWWVVVLAKLWWEAFLKEARYMLDVIENDQNNS
jgi:TRAP-type C4-dicarboxylate transport system permease small subunit